MLVLRFAETAIGLQWNEILLIVLLGVVGGLIVMAGGIVFSLSRVGAGLIIMGIGSVIVTAGISWANLGNTQQWWMVISVLAVIGGIVIEILDETGLIHVDLYPIYYLLKNMRNWHVR
jgi:drug/metabolite transporter (DMT)-like permease